MVSADSINQGIDRRSSLTMRRSVAIAAAVLEGSTGLGWAGLKESDQ